MSYRVVCCKGQGSRERVVNFEDMGSVDISKHDSEASVETSTCQQRFV